MQVTEERMTGDVEGTHAPTWVVSLTTNMSMDERCLPDTAEAVDNDDGTATYTVTVRAPRARET